MKHTLAALLLAAAQFSSGVNLVEVYVTVTDAKGEPVQNLTREDFEVLEDGDPQETTAFAAGEFPLAVAVGLDRSFSMAGAPLAIAKSAAERFLQELRPEDQAMLIGIGGEAEIVAPLSRDRSAQKAALAKLDAWGTTPLHDAIIAAIDHIQPAAGRRALILLSDGNDRYSRATAAETLDRARRGDVLVYPVAMGETRPALFAELAVVTGGRSFHLRKPDQLEDTFRTIARELRYQYLLGYTPKKSLEGADEEWRSIQVKVNRPGVRVRARDGYLAGTR
jgi:Ca-activated chloride channel family protein